MWAHQTTQPGDHPPGGEVTSAYSRRPLHSAARDHTDAARRTVRTARQLKANELGAGPSLKPSCRCGAGLLSAIKSENDDYLQDLRT